MKELDKKLQPTAIDSKKPTAKDTPYEDDRYPGSFFRVPGVPRPGKTTWKIS